MALVNLAELASGLAMVTATGDAVRGIPVAISIRYHLKARGLLTATGTAAPPAVTSPIEAMARAEIHDASGALVADADVTWRLSPQAQSR